MANMLIEYQAINEKITKDQIREVKWERLAALVAVLKLDKVEKQMLIETVDEYHKAMTL